MLNTYLGPNSLVLKHIQYHTKTKMLITRYQSMPNIPDPLYIKSLSKIWISQIRVRLSLMKRYLISMNEYLRKYFKLHIRPSSFYRRKRLSGVTSQFSNHVTSQSKKIFKLLQIRHFWSDFNVPHIKIFRRPGSF